MKMWPLIGVALMGSPAFAAEQFDLVCKGTQTIHRERPPAEPTNEKRPWDFRYRVDLRTKTYCEDLPKRACGAVSKIQEITPQYITFTAFHDEHMIGSVMVDRFSGDYLEKVRMGKDTIDIEAVCVPADFSGFPKSLF